MDQLRGLRCRQPTPKLLRQFLVCAMPSNRLQESKNAMREVLAKVIGGPLDRAAWNAASRGDVNSIRRLYKIGANLRARDDESLCRACEHGNLDVVRYLQQNGVPLNARDDEPLCRACEHDHVDLVRYLHHNG